MGKAGDKGGLFIGPIGNGDAGRLAQDGGAAIGGDFTLQSAAGPVSLKDYRGKLVLVYFGYTFCPDICPTSLAATAEGLKLLTPDAP